MILDFADGIYEKAVILASWVNNQTGLDTNVTAEDILLNANGEQIEIYYRTIKQNTAKDFLSELLNVLKTELSERLI